VESEKLESKWFNYGGMAITAIGLVIAASLLFSMMKRNMQQKTPVTSPSVSVEQISPTPVMTPVTGKFAQISCTGCVANFRSLPSFDGQIIGTVANGELVQVSGRQSASDGVTWAQVAYRGRTGWLSSEFLMEVDNGRL
jgi:hypothetical protein